MPSTGEKEASPRAGQHQEHNHDSSAQISTAAPKPTARRSERIREKELANARGSSVSRPIASETPTRATKETRSQRRNPRKSDSCQSLGRTPIRESATAPNLPDQDRTTTGLPQEAIRRWVEETGEPRDSPELSDSDLQKLRLYSRLDSWLEQVRTSPEADVDPFFSNRRTPSSSDMAPTVSRSTESLAISERQSTVRPGRREVKRVSLVEGLRTRLVEFGERVKDPKAAELKAVIIANAVDIRLAQTESLRNHIELFLGRADGSQGGASIYDTVEELSNAINEWKSTVRMATTTNRDFNKDLEHCKFPANEAVFQRTVLMSILNRHQIGDQFDFNCEGQWSLRSNYYALPSTEENSIPAPKPDLAIFFRYSSLVGRGTYWKSTPIPDYLKPCMSPDGYIQRCFPFVFIEAKKGFRDLTPALVANMHSASQALFNIYVWMSEAGHKDEFFSDVRLFSIAINAREFVLRVHRAQVVEESEGLEFYYDDICRGYEYERDNICNLIQNILVGYAEKTLLNVLRQSVLAVVRNQREMQALKRKSEAAGLSPGDPLSKRMAVATSNKVAGSSVSYGMSQVNI
ncbi:hypothetical protein SAMD00023353_0700270 [Rosellinia necatrix]|uniref:DUF7924 domain-containing protein n=1 Tax=Rosellinia necatrix TaxID=77044 RepID=A0A1S7ULN6_ROSNE|nr:hypothetical protein SAMD00023353_0700270 [Rosellinia necatrix]